MRQLSRHECSAVGCTNEASVKINDDLLCHQCAHTDLPDVEVCPTHNMVLGEGAPCAGCEEAAHAQYCNQAFSYIDQVVHGSPLNYIGHRHRTPGQHIAFLAMTMGVYGASQSQIIEIMRNRDIPGSSETVQAVLDYLK